METETIAFHFEAGPAPALAPPPAWLALLLTARLAFYDTILFICPCLNASTPASAPAAATAAAELVPDVAVPRVLPL